MSLKEKLMDDLKTAMRNKDKLNKDAITLIRADIKRKEVDERIELTDQQILDIISKQLKEKKASIEDFKKGNRQDLVDKTNDEIQVLLRYLPEQLSEDELRKIVVETIKKENISSQKEIGKLMKAVMPLVKGKADGKEVNKIALDYFNEPRD